MTRQTAILLICAALAAGCHRTQTARRGSENYQVVEEGQASGVTSTINAPGETPPPLTDTAFDTTTNFTLPDNPAPLGTLPPNTVAGTLPTYTSYPTAPPRPKPVAPPPMSSGTVQQPQPQPQQPSPTDTAVTDEVLPPTDTAASPPPEKKKEGEQTDTSTTTTTTATPPPPTPPV
ncbi:MAG: hypothetical protein AABO58_13865 [Acidobacteriota bacterium]